MLACIVILWIFYRHYTYRKPFWDELKDIYFSIFVISFINLALLVFAKIHDPTETWISVYIVLFLCFPIFRFFCKKILKIMKLWEMPSVIIGTGGNAFRAYKAIQQETNLGYKVNAFVSDQKIGVFAKHVDFISEQVFLTQLNHYEKVFIALESNESDLMYPLFLHYKVFLFMVQKFHISLAQKQLYYVFQIILPNVLLAL